MQQMPSLAYVLEPRFPGGTSAAVAAELRQAVRAARVSVHGIASRMFGADQRVAPRLAEALADLSLGLGWDGPAVSADVVVLHNPSFLRFQDNLATRFLCRDLVVVAHENFLRPGGQEAFDVRRCLDLIGRSTLALRKWIAPVSAASRASVTGWLATDGRPDGWRLIGFDWFNICDMELREPTRHPRDRRGRLSRPGVEKFPGLADMDMCFPAHAQANVILGADHWQAAGIDRPHWCMYPFQGLAVTRFFEMIDFMVYFTAPTWRESFGRVLAEAIAAGKVVLSDPDTASIFGGGVVACAPASVDGHIAQFIADPPRYRDRALMAQDVLRGFSGDAFRARLEGFLQSRSEVPA